MSVSKKQLIANRENAWRSIGSKTNGGKHIATSSIPDEHHAFNILRYEMRLDRQLTRTYQLLRHLQEHRNAGSGGLPPKNKKITQRSHLPISSHPMVTYRDFFRFGGGKVPPFLLALPLFRPRQTAHLPCGMRGPWGRPARLGGCRPQKK